MSVTIDLPPRITEYIEVMRTVPPWQSFSLEEIAARFVEQGVWRVCGEVMGFSKTPAEPANPEAPPAQDWPPAPAEYDWPPDEQSTPPQG